MESLSLFSAVKCLSFDSFCFFSIHSTAPIAVDSSVLQRKFKFDVRIKGKGSEIWKYGKKNNTMSMLYSIQPVWKVAAQLKFLARIPGRHSVPMSFKASLLNSLAKHNSETQSLLKLRNANKLCKKMIDF